VGLIPRHGPLKRLAQAARVTVVSAPAGSGKTFLLRSWIAEEDVTGSAAWVAVGAEHRDPQQFWVQVLDALRGTVPGSRVVRELTAAPGLDDWLIVERLLLAEVLERQPEAVRRLLLRTSIRDRVSGPLADALTGDADGEATLLRLEQANAFVTAKDPGRTWFRYHRLFADLLKLELRRTAPTSRVGTRDPVRRPAGSVCYPSPGPASGPRCCTRQITTVSSR
jgi:LuxR family maltose regulon positive regulatory protein